MIRVLHVITHSKIGGAQGNTLLTILGLKEKGFQVELAYGSFEPGKYMWLPDELTNKGIKVHIIPSLAREISPGKDILALKELISVMYSGGYKIVHTHSTKAGLLGRLAASLTRVPAIVHTVHSGITHIPVFDKLFLCAESLGAKLSDKIITNGQSLKEEMLKFGVANKDKVVPIYSGINFKGLSVTKSPDYLYQELGLKKGTFIIGFVGRLCEQKSPTTLIEAMEEVNRKLGNVVLLLAGDGPLRPLLKQMAKARHLEKIIKFLGERDDIPNLLSVFHVFALSSMWEGIGRALTEAMYMKLPVVVTAVNGVPELVEHNKTGLLVPPKNPRALASAIITVLRDSKLAKTLGENAHKKVYPMMCADKMVNEIETLYLELLEKKRLVHPQSIYIDRMNQKVSVFTKPMPQSVPPIGSILSPREHGKREQLTPWSSARERYSRSLQK